jgi:hypothetical protein
VQALQKRVVHQVVRAGIGTPMRRMRFALVRTFRERPRCRNARNAYEFAVSWRA